MIKLRKALFGLAFACLAVTLTVSAEVSITKTEYVDNNLMLYGKLSEIPDEDTVFLADGENGVGFINQGTAPEYVTDEQYGKCIKMLSGSSENASVTYILPEPYEGEKFTLSYDVMSFQSTQTLFISMNPWYARKERTENTVYGMYMGTNGIGHAPRGTWHTGNPESEVPYETNRWYHFDSVYDLEARKVSYYLDGVLIGETEIYENTLENGVYSVLFSAPYDNGPGDGSAAFYIDNVCIKDNSYTELYADCQVSGSFIDVSFSDTVLNTDEVEFTLINNKNQNEIILDGVEVINPRKIRITRNGGLTLDEGYTLKIGNAEGISGKQLANTEILLKKRQVSLDILSEGKTYDDLLTAENYMDVIKYRAQTECGYDGSFSFKIGLAENGTYTAYISDEQNREKAEDFEIYYNPNPYEFKSDFESYSGGVPSDWSKVSGVTGNFEAVADGDGTHLKLNIGNSELRLFKELPSVTTDFPVRISFDIKTEGEFGGANIKYMDKYVTTRLDTDNEPYVYELFNIDSDLNPENLPHVSPRGYMGYYINQKTDYILSENDMKYENGCWYNVDVWLDFNVKKAVYYVNGSYLGEAQIKTDIDMISGIAFCMESGGTDSKAYIDNVIVRSVPYSFGKMFAYNKQYAPDFVTDLCGISISTDNLGNVFFGGNAAFYVNVYTDEDIPDAKIQYTVESGGNIQLVKEENISLRKGMNNLSYEGKAAFGKHKFMVKIISGKETAVESTNFSVANIPDAGVKNYNFGIGNHLDPKYGESTNLSYFNDKAGFGYARNSITWRTYQLSEDEYELPEWFSKHYDITYDAGIKHLITLGTDCPQIGVNGIPDSPEELAALEEYVYNAVLEHTGNGNSYEFYNEFPFDEQGDNAVEKYINIMKSVNAGVKKADPEAKIFGFAAAHTMYEWIPKVIEAGGGQYIDGISIHKYVNGAPDTYELISDDIRSIRKMMDENGMEDMPLWMSEYGWSLLNVSEREQAENLVKGVVINAAEGLLDKMFFYTIEDKPEYKNSTTRSTELAYGIIKAQNAHIPYEAKEAYLAACNYNACLTGMELESVSLDKGYSLYKFRNGSRYVSCVWSNEGADVLLSDIYGSEAVTVLDIFGNEILPYADADGNYRITLSKTPVYLIADLYEVSVYMSGEKLEKLSDAETGCALEIKVSGIYEIEADVNVFVCEFKDGILISAEKYDLAEYKTETAASIPYTRKDGGKLSVLIWKENMMPLSAAYSL